MEVEFFTNTSTANVNGITYVTLDGPGTNNNHQLAAQWTVFSGEPLTVEKWVEVAFRISGDWETRSDKRRDDNLRGIFG